MRARLFSFLVAVVLSLLSCELTLFLLNYPQNISPIDPLPGSTVKDPQLGWRHQPGIYHYFSTELERTIGLSILPNFSRATAPNPVKGKREVILIGCSFVEGFGLDDTATLGWKLQSALPQYSIVNLGTGGYGTYQSLLSLQRYREANSNSEHPIILYGLAEFHPLRNIKNNVTHRYWNSPGIFPVCSQDGCDFWEGKKMGGSLGYSRLYSLLENIVDAVRASRDQERSLIVTDNLLSRLQSYTKEIGGELIVFPVAPLSERWISTLQSKNIELKDCSSRLYEGSEYHLSDGHPNERWTSAVATCLGDTILSVINN